MGNEIDGDAGTFTKKPKTEGFRNTSRRLKKDKENHLNYRASFDWRLDQTSVCNKQSDATIAHINLEELKTVILKSRTGKALLQGESANGLKIYYDSQTPQSQFYPRGKKSIIALNPHHPRGDLLNILIRELRHAWQHYQGALVNPMNFEPDGAVLVNRAQQADILMMSVKVAWELKLVGESEAWDFMIGSSMVDVTRVFEVHARKDFRSLNNGEAARAAYDKFFDDSRTKIHDKRIIHQMLLDDQGYMKALGKQPKADMALFKKLGELPFGRNYLTLCGKRQPTDMCYSTIEDRSNANFLWFIKFERSFQEKELEMVQTSVKTSAEIVDFAKWVFHTRPPAGYGL
ncbi:MAG: hypothetical protein KAI61_00215 [Alphaproteobacteria bacterium]|nr:hypothetical protein [Alphaproteobacteria bacterium]